MKTTLLFFTIIALSSCSNFQGPNAIPIQVGASYVGSGFVVSTSYNTKGGVALNVAVDPALKKAGTEPTVTVGVTPVVSTPQVIATK